MNAPRRWDLYARMSLLAANTFGNSKPQILNLFELWHQFTSRVCSLSNIKMPLSQTKLMKSIYFRDSWAELESFGLAEPLPWETAFAFTSSIPYLIDIKAYVLLFDGKI